MKTCNRYLSLTVLVLLACLSFLVWKQNHTDVQGFVNSTASRQEAGTGSESIKIAANPEVMPSDDGKIFSKDDFAQVKTIYEFRQKFYNKKPGELEKLDSLPEVAKFSAWENRNKNYLNSIMGKSEYDIVVFPVQLQKVNVDRVSRMLTARMIAEEIRRRSGMKVMPVELVQRLLGSRIYWVNFRDGDALASAFKAKKLIYIYIDKTENDEIKIGISVSKGIRVERVYTGIFPITPDSETLELVVKKNLNELVTALVDTDAPVNSEKWSGEFPRFNFDISLADLADDSDNPLYEVMKLQLLSILLPGHEFYERNRLMERSLIALDKIDRATKYYELFKARALFYLYRRPLALETIKNDNTAEGIAFLNYLNGNYTDLLAQYEKLNNEYFKVLAFIELHDLAESYGKDARLIQKPKINDPGWLALLLHRTKENDPWYAPDNFTFFSSIYGMFPQFDNTLKEFVKDKAITGELNQQISQIDIVFEKLYDKFISENSSSLCCNIYSTNISRLDILNFYRSSGIGNLLRTMNKLTQVQASFTSAQNRSHMFDIYFYDHLSFMLYKVIAASGMADRSTGIEKINYVKFVKENSEYILSASAGTDMVSVLSEYYFKQQYSNYFELFKTTYIQKKGYELSKDIPYGILYHEMYSNPEAINYTNRRFSIIKRIQDDMQNGKSTFQTVDLDNILSTRFNGHPGKSVLLATKYLAENNKNEALRLLETTVAEGANDWNIYKKLCELYVLSGQYIKADKLLSNYTAFTKPDVKDSVAISNQSYSVGTMFFERGEIELARKYYKISSDLENGSEASLLSKMRIAMFDGDYQTALDIARYSASRYRSESRYGDMLVFLTLTGKTDEASRLLDDLSMRIYKLNLWTSRIVHDRIKKTNIDDISAWAKEYKLVGDERKSYQVNRYLVMHLMFDRKYSPKKQKVISDAVSLGEFESKIHPKMAGESVVYLYLDNADKERIEIEKQKRELSDQEKFNILENSSVEEKITIPSRLKRFVDAYSSLQSKEYEKAYEIYKNLVKYSGLEYTYNSFGSEILPFLTYSAVRSGNIDKIGRFLIDTENQSKTYSFDFLLSKAIFLAGKNEIDESIVALNDAQYNIPDNEHRFVYAQYQLIQVCEWLYEISSDQRFLELGIQWSRKLQRTEPHISWAYAFEARYSNDTSERVRASAFASYLDPDSDWLSQVPQSIQNSARKWWVKNNPFKGQKKSTNQNKVISKYNNQFLIL